MDQETYEFHQENEEEPFTCLNCTFPFTKLNDYQFDNLVNKGFIESHNLKFKPTPAQKAAIDKLNKYIEHCNQNTITEPDNEYEQPINCSYYSCEEFMSAEFNPKLNFSILHINIHSITLHIKELRLLLETLDYKFDIIAISESKLKDEPTVNVNIAGYRPPSINYTEAEKGGTMIYI